MGASHLHGVDEEQVEDEVEEGVGLAHSQRDLELKEHLEGEGEGEGPNTWLSSVDVLTLNTALLGHSGNTCLLALSRVELAAAAAPRRPRCRLRSRLRSPSPSGISR